MADPYLAYLDATFVAENWSGALIVRSGIDGRVTNSGVPRYRGLAERHLVVGGGEQIDDDIVALTAETIQSAIRVSFAARQLVLLDDQPVKAERVLVREDGYIGQDIQLDLKPGERHTIEKVVVLFTSRDRAISEPSREARDKARRAPDLPDLLARHVLAWDHRGSGATCGSAATSGPTACCTCTCSTCCRRCPRTVWTSTWASRRAGCTVRATGAISK